MRESKKRSKSILVSIIIANLNGEIFVDRCLASIFKEKDFGFEVIVVDDGSTDRSQLVLEKWHRKQNRIKTIFLTKNLGAAMARNIGAKNSRGKYLFFLDNDTTVTPGWFRAVIDFFGKNKMVGLAQTKILKTGTNRFDYAGDLISRFGFLVERAREAVDRGQFDQAGPIFGLKSAAMLVRKNVFDQIEGFDANYHIFWEDTDFAWRTWLAGWQVWFMPTIKVYHAYGTDQKGLKIYQTNKVVYRGAKNMICSLIKNLETKNLIITLPISIICWLALSVGFILKADFAQGLAIAKGLLWNLVWLPRTIKKRKQIQLKRKITDQKLFLLVGDRKDLGYYFGKALAYLQGKPF